MTAMVCPNTESDSEPFMGRHFPQAIESADTPFGHVRSAQSHRRWHRATRCEHRPAKDLPSTEPALSTTGTHGHGDRAGATTSVRSRRPPQNRPANGTHTRNDTGPHGHYAAQRPSRTWWGAQSPARSGTRAHRTSLRCSIVTGPAPRRSGVKREASHDLSHLSRRRARESPDPKTGRHCHQLRRVRPWLRTQQELVGGTFLVLRSHVSRCNGSAHPEEARSIPDGEWYEAFRDAGRSVSLRTVRDPLAAQHAGDARDTR